MNTRMNIYEEDMENLKKIQDYVDTRYHHLLYCEASLSKENNSILIIRYRFLQDHMTYVSFSRIQQEICFRVKEIFGNHYKVVFRRISS